MDDVEGVLSRWMVNRGCVKGMLALVIGAMAFCPVQHRPARAGLGASAFEVARLRWTPSTAYAQDGLVRAESMFGEGVRAYEAGQLDEAARSFEAAYRLSPQPELAFNIARVYERMGDADRAIRWFRRYLRQSSELDVDARRAIEARIAAMEELKQRLRQQVMAQTPSADEMTREGRVFFERGVAMFRRRRYDAALAAFTAAYRFAPLPEVIYNIAVASERTHHLQDAVDYYREYLRQRPDGADRAWVERHIAELRARVD